MSTLSLLDKVLFKDKYLIPNLFKTWVSTKDIKDCIWQKSKARFDYFASNISSLGSSIISDSCSSSVSPINFPDYSYDYESDGTSELTKYGWLQTLR
jgi:hypothetical protein